METQCCTDPEEFMRFNKLLTAGRPDYQPFYFPLKRGGKDPWDKVSWKNNRKTVRECRMLMSKGYNIGVAARENDPLVIIDVDDMSQVPEIKNTLQVTSRKRIGRHNYFFAKDKSAKQNIATGDAGEVRSNWQYVVAPGSFVKCKDEDIEKMPECERKNAGRYSLNNEFPVSEITFEEFPEVYKKRASEIAKDRIKPIVNAVIRNPATKKAPFIAVTNGRRSALWDLSISDVSGVPDTGGKKVPMPLEMHTTDTTSGQNCSVSNGLLHCWRHYCFHNAFSYLTVVAGILPCERAGRPHRGDFFGVDTHDGETVLKVWLYAKENNLIPKNDPIPKSALIAFAIQKGVTRKESISKEFKLNDLQYHLTLKLLESEGIEHGRN